MNFHHGVGPVMYRRTSILQEQSPMRKASSTVSFSKVLGELAFPHEWCFVVALHVKECVQVVQSFIFKVDPFHIPEATKPDIISRVLKINQVFGTNAGFSKFRFGC